MDRVHFVHLSGPRTGEEIALEHLPATVGSQPGADLEVAGSAPQHAMVLRRDAHVVLRDAGSPQGTLLAGQPVQEVVLQDGDVVELGPGGPRLRVHLVSGRHISETMAYRIVHRTSRSFRRILLFVLAGSLGLFAWTFHQSRRFQHELQSLRHSLTLADEERRGLEERIETERSRARNERAELKERLEEYREREEGLRDRLAEAAGGEVNSLREELLLTRERIRTLESERAAGENVIRRYGGGVACSRAPTASTTPPAARCGVVQDDEGATRRGSDGEPLLSVDGEGPAHRVEFYGTGFLVDAKRADPHQPPPGRALVERQRGRPAPARRLPGPPHLPARLLPPA